MPHALLLDENMQDAVAAQLRLLGYDVVTISELGLKSTHDPLVLEAATRMGRVVVTFNIKDFVLLARQWAEQPRPHGGILLVRQAEIGDLVRRLSIWLEENPDLDMNFFCDYLPRYEDRP